MLGRAGMKRLTPHGMPALISRANLPDIDSFFAPLCGEEPIDAHRGFTHGLGGLVTMPFLAAAIILLWQRLRPSKEGPVKLGGLLLACFLGTLSHPLLDFATSYGTRLLEPFSHRWFYGDTLFIMDPWIWLMLIIGLEMSWRAERLGRNWTRPAIWALARCSATSRSTPRSACARSRSPARWSNASRRPQIDRGGRGSADLLEAQDDLARRRHRRDRDI